MVAMYIRWQDWSEYSFQADFYLDWIYQRMEEELKVGAVEGLWEETMLQQNWS
jgi:hypothetical protein